MWLDDGWKSWTPSEPEWPEWYVAEPGYSEAPYLVARYSDGSEVGPYPVVFPQP